MFVNGMCMIVLLSRLRQIFKGAQVKYWLAHKCNQTLVLLMIRAGVLVGLARGVIV